MARRSVLTFLIFCVATITPVASAQGLPGPDEARVKPAAKAKPYIERGMPSPARPWTSSDYEQAIKALAQMKKDKSLPLPRFHDDPSGLMFARMINIENFDMMRDEKAPMSTRMGEALGLIGMIRPLLMVYFEPEVKGRQPYGREILEIATLSYSVYRHSFKLIDQFWDSLSPEAKAEPARKKGLDQIRNGVATTIMSALMFLGETDQYTAEDLRIFAARLPENMPPLWNFIDPLNQDEFRLKIKELAQSHPDQQVRASIVKLDEAVSRGAKTPSPEKPKEVIKKP